MEKLIVNRIEDLFEKTNDPVLNVYFTAGFPQLKDTITILKALEDGGADMIEIGMPFSDPVADGPTIQDSNQVALENGMNLEKLFDQLRGMRDTISLPVVLMGYINPILQYGVERFCEDAAACGVDGLILPDLPMDEYLEVYKPIFDQFGLLNIYLITPQTSENRIRQIDENTRGFIYMVSSASITGAKKGISEGQVDYFRRIEAMNLRNPRLIGFGISDHESFAMASRYSSGAIIGSAFINILQEHGAEPTAIQKFIKSVKGI